MCEICDKNISKEKYEKLKNYLFKVKELNKTVLEKRVQQKALCQRRAGGGEIPPSLEVVFETFDSN